MGQYPRALVLAGLSANMSAESRSFPFEKLATVSTGYDSSMVTTLAVESGCSQALCFDEARGGTSDAGKEIAETLGVPYEVVPMARCCLVRGSFCLRQRHG